jgi:hypothetical protein
MVFSLRLHEATPSNCGNPLKPLIPSISGNGYVAKRNELGYGKNSKDDTLANVKMGNPQPSPKALKRYGCCSET